MAEIEKEKVIAVLNRILERELAGVVRYTHYSFLVFGFGRIPLVSWLRDQATEATCSFASGYQALVSVVRAIAFGFSGITTDYTRSNLK